MATAIVRPMPVGVIVPVHGEAPWLRETLGSVLAQEPWPEVVVVVDDGSSPPLELPPELAAEVHLVRREETGGAPLARAAGLAAIDCDLIALCDADDTWTPGKLAMQLRTMDEDHPRAAACFGAAEVIEADGKPTGERWQRPAGPVPPSEMARQLYTANPVATSSVVLRADALRDVGGFEATGPPPCEDLDLWLRLTAAGATFVSEPRAVVRYRRHPGGLTQDLVALGNALVSVHTAHGDQVDDATRDAALAQDHAGVARGHIRAREWPAARAALLESRRLGGARGRERALSAATRVPGLRAALGRRDPYTR
jgi:hypothetical protein